MEAGVHLPQIAFGAEGFSLRRLIETVDAARDHGCAAVSVNDHFLFGSPWLDGPTALAAAVERSGTMTLATTVALAALRGPVPLAKTLATLDVLSGGRVIAGLGPGSSQRDYDALGVPFEQRWQRFDAAVVRLRALLAAGAPLAPVPHQPGGVPLWIGSWGSSAGLRRVARLGDGWLASAYNTTPVRFAAALRALRAELAAQGREADRFPHALVTMWTWITEDHHDAERVLTRVLAPLLNRDPEALRDRLCIGPAGRCAELLARYAEAGCRRVHFWALGAEARQIELLTAILPGA